MQIDQMFIPEGYSLSDNSDAGKHLVGTEQ